MFYCVACFDLADKTETEDKSKTKKKQTHIYVIISHNILHFWLCSQSDSNLAARQINRYQ